MYKGTNPNNYITFNNETWRIISVESDNTIKIMRNDYIDVIYWDRTYNNDWARPADLNTYLNGEYLNSITMNKDKIKTDASWSIGGVIDSNTDLAAQITSEKDTSWTGAVALPTVSEYLRTITMLNSVEHIA